MTTFKRTRDTHFTTTFVCVDTEDKTAAPTGAIIGVFVCPACSDTHLEISLPEMGLKLATIFAPECAELLGQKLINPHPRAAAE